MDKNSQTTNIEQEGNFYIFTSNNKKNIAIPTGLKEKSKGLFSLTSYRKESGWIIKDNQIQKWYFKGFKVINNEMCLFGDFPEGKPLKNIFKEDTTSGMKNIIRLINVLEVIEKEKIPTFEFQLDSVFFLNNGGILILPPTLLNRIKDTRPVDYIINNHEYINHPYLAPEKKAAYSINVILYRLFTGEFPYSDTKLNTLRNKIRSLNSTKPVYLLPELKIDTSDAIYYNLKNPGNNSLAKIKKLLLEWIETGIHRTISPAEKEELLTNIKKRKEKANKYFSKKIFIEKYWKKITIISLVIILASIIPISIISSMLKPRVTKGLGPIEVTELFYSSINSLDHDVMADCLINNAGSKILDEVISLYIYSRQSFSIDRTYYHIYADEWEKNGKKTVKYPYYVYGILNFNLTIKQEGEEFIILVSYDKYTRQEIESEQNIPDIFYYGMYMEEKLYLKQDHDDWVIYKLDLIKSIPISD